MTTPFGWTRMCANASGTSSLSHTGRPIASIRSHGATVDQIGKAGRQNSENTCSLTGRTTDIVAEPPHKLHPNLHYLGK